MLIMIVSSNACRNSTIIAETSVCKLGFETGNRKREITSKIYLDRKTSNNVDVFAYSFLFRDSLYLNVIHLVLSKSIIQI